HHREGVGAVTARVLRRGPVDRLEHRTVVAEIAAWRHPEAADQAGPEAGYEVAVEDGHYEHVELVGPHHELAAERVHPPVVELDVGMLGGHFLRGLEEDAVALLHHVRLVHGGHPSATVLARVRERATDDAPAGAARKPFDRDRRVARELGAMRARDELPQHRGGSVSAPELDAGIEVLVRHPDDND